ncbi:hypothetical protein STENM223S_07388 [Streptomyces tendae]
MDQTIPAANRRVATLSIPDATLPTGSYTWKVLAKDQDGATSTWSKPCKFQVDRKRPHNPPIITSVDNKFPSGDTGWPTRTGAARETGQLTFAPNEVTDVNHYVWFTDHDPDLHTAKPGVPATITPPNWGPHLVYAYSVDNAGNRSDTATYLYYAGAATQRDGYNDLNGDTLRDIWSIDSNGTLLTYAGQGDEGAEPGKGNGQFSSATNGGARSFAGASVTSRDDWGQDGYNDLIALEYDGVDKRKKLWMYQNNGLGVISDNTRNSRFVANPTITGPPPNRSSPPATSTVTHSPTCWSSRASSCGPTTATAAVTASTSVADLSWSVTPTGTSSPSSLPVT